MNIILEKIKKILQDAINDLGFKGNLIIEKPKQIKDADYSTNFAMINSKINELSPLEIAEKIVEKIKENNAFEKVDFVKPGFINLTINKKLLFEVLQKINELKSDFGRSNPKNFTYNLELVSANPTGYLHIGHARNGAIGDAVARILKFAGYNVQTEYYTNDAGNQINIAANTLFYHYKNLLNSKVNTPEEMYGGDMYKEVAQLLVEEFQDKYISYDIVDEKINDSQIHEIFREKVVSLFLKEIKNQLKMLDVNIETFSSEKKMYDDNEIEKLIEKFKELGVVYTKEDALWLKTTQFGDDKDRVLVKADGDYTYITPDIANHNMRIQKAKADKYVNFWGGDHHGYITRLRAGLALLGYDFNLVDIDMIQMVRLIKDGAELKMSKRKGTAVWLIDLLEMVGKDSIRYMLISKAASSHMDFDLDLAVAKNSNNPVYYAQYATARCYKLISSFNQDINISDFSLLVENKEKEIIIALDDFNKTIEYAATNRLPNIICDYIQNLAKLFHSYYSEFKIIDENNIDLSRERIYLVNSIYQVLSNAFNLIGIDVKNNM